MEISLAMFDRNNQLILRTRYYDEETAQDAFDSLNGRLKNTDKYAALVIDFRDEYED